MKVQQTVYNCNLRKPDRITVECGHERRFFAPDEKCKVGKWLSSLWSKQEEDFGWIVTPEAMVYYDIDWDNDHTLYCKFTATC